MGRIPLQNPKSAELLPSWRAQPGMLGVRLTFLGPAAKWLDDGTADWFWPAVTTISAPLLLGTCDGAWFNSSCTLGFIATTS
jgi:hypothetical protein